MLLCQSKTQQSTQVYYASTLLASIPSIIPGSVVSQQHQQASVPDREPVTPSLWCVWPLERRASSMSYHYLRCNTYATSEKRTLLDSGQRAKSRLPTELLLPLNSGHTETTPPLLHPDPPPPAAYTRAWVHILGGGGAYAHARVLYTLDHAELETRLVHAALFNTDADLQKSRCF